MRPLFRFPSLATALTLAAACGDAHGRDAPVAPALPELAAATAPSVPRPSAPPPSAQTPAPDPAAAVPGDPPRSSADGAYGHEDLACRFEAVRESPGKPAEKWEWFLWRRNDRVETRETLTDAGEVWLRDPVRPRVGGHLKVFHAERRTVEYAAGDLAALGATTAWDAVASVFPEARLAALRKVGPAEVLGRPAVRYAGRLGPAEYDVTWVPSLRLPGSVRKASDGQFLTFRLREVHPLAAAPWNPPDSSAYGVTEFSDVGCGSTDPFLRRFHAYLASPSHAACR